MDDDSLILSWTRLNTNAILNQNSRQNTNTVQLIETFRYRNNDWVWRKVWDFCKVFGHHWFVRKFSLVWLQMEKKNKKCSVFDLSFVETNKKVHADRHTHITLCTHSSSKCIRCIFDENFFNCYINWMFICSHTHTQTIASRLNMKKKRWIIIKLSEHLIEHQKIGKQSIKSQKDKLKLIAC